MNIKIVQINKKQFKLIDKNSSNKKKCSNEKKIVQLKKLQK